MDIIVQQDAEDRMIGLETSADELYADIRALGRGFLIFSKYRKKL